MFYNSLKKNLMANTFQTMVKSVTIKLSKQLQQH